MNENQLNQYEPEISRDASTTTEKIITREQRAQEYVWKRPTDEEVSELSKPIKNYVDNLKAPTTYKPTPQILNYVECIDLQQLSSTSRLIDLGSADDVTNSTQSLKFLEQIGISEYISVDAAFGENSDLKIRKSASKGDDIDHPKIKVQSLRKEILDALHSMPDNYGNIYSMGLDSIVFNLDDKWILTVLSEMKRVLPEGGIIFTDGMYLDRALEICCPNFKKVKEALSRYGSYKDSPTEKQEKELFLSQYICKEDDPYSRLYKRDPLLNEYETSRPGVKYCIDLPEIGFSIYCNTIDTMQPFFIVNKKKNRE
jgi:hypothetical protein